MLEAVAYFLGFVVFVMVLTVLVRIGAVRMGRAAGRSTRKRFEEAEHIVETGQAPQTWLDETATLGGEAKRRKLIRRLDRLIEFFRTARVVADEATRELLLDRLRAAREQWRTEGAGSQLTDNEKGA